MASSALPASAASASLTSPPLTRASPTSPATTLEASSPIFVSLNSGESFAVFKNHASPSLHSWTKSFAWDARKA